MPDKVQQTFVRCFIGYLKKQVESHALIPDAAESVEVAIQCLQAAFDVGEDDEEPQTDQAPSSDVASVQPTEPADVQEIDLFELFQSLYIERNPQSLQLAESIKNEGNRLMKDGKYNEALLQYNRAITFDPKNPIFYCNRAAAFVRLGDNLRAVTDCKSALVYNPNYGKAYNRLGIAYSNLSKYEEAQQAYAKAIEIEPDNVDYRNNMEGARNARSQIPADGAPQMSHVLNTMLSSPTVRNLFSSAEIDLEQVQSMSQDPMFLSAFNQLFSGMQGGIGGGGGISGDGGVPPMQTDMMQLLQSFVGQMAGPGPNQNNAPGGNRSAGGGANDGPQQPPPST